MVSKISSVGYILPNHSLTAFHPDELFDTFLEDSCRALLKTDDSHRQLREEIKLAVVEYEEAGNSIDEVHRRNLTRYPSYWQSIRPRTLCFACLIHVSEYFFPCKHAICEQCRGRYFAPAISDQDHKMCIFCSHPFKIWSKGSAKPRSAVRALVYRYHDLFMAILDIGIRLRPWRSQSIMQVIIFLGKEIIKHPERYIDVRGGWSNTWRNLVDVASTEYPYERESIRRGISSAFGIDIWKRTGSKGHLDPNLVWPLITNLFSFELEGVEKCGKNSYECRGMVKCSPLHRRLYEQIAEASGVKVQLSIQGFLVQKSPPCTVHFHLAELSEMVDIKLCVGETAASIAGLPSQLVKHKPSHKRRRGADTSTASPSKRPRRLLAPW